MQGFPFLYFSYIVITPEMLSMQLIINTCFAHVTRRHRAWMMHKLGVGGVSEAICIHYIDCAQEVRQRTFNRTAERRGCKRAFFRLTIPALCLSSACYFALDPRCIGC
ncbi:hypothetical protein F5B22DRAFT_592615 [Xylaria bambusicola]|uniref:uncharacterized protein n=1 Tax=Xylaria bambusicola TaxID=326684 RepID=UPI002008BAED|nr:uncharacterized protein F5B22DRAFT_592615 [Xylaria bambusicola]KAI0522040.1 hypothetical protein F5B22DRAFT_592615 [Xylaria bambusicola]